jgi:hypothetical protein
MVSYHREIKFLSENRMQVRITSVAAEEVASALRSITTVLEKSLSPYFLARDYGGQVEILVIVLVAVDPDPVENQKYCAEHNEFASFEHPYAKTRTKYVSFALPFNPSEIATMNERELRIAVSDALMTRLEQPDLRFPKEFDYPRLSLDLSIAMQIFKRAEV